MIEEEIEDSAVFRADNPQTDTTSLDDFDEDELDEFPDADIEELRATPVRIMLLFTGVDTGDDTLDGVVEFLIAEAESRGLFHQCSMGTVMDLDEVDPKSKLHEVITGREVDT